MTAGQYESISRCFRTHGWEKALEYADVVLTGIDIILYPALIVWQFLNGGSWLRTVIGAGIPFFLLSLLRKWIDRPRPYEALDIVPLLKKDTSGCSFPSRHVFSAFLIAMCYFSVNIRMGIGLLLAGTALGLLRVIGGVHYPSDVIAGALLGTLSGYVSFYFL